MLFDIAGGSLDRFTTTDSRENGAFLAASRRLAYDLLDHWCSPNLATDAQPHELLKMLCGYRLESGGTNTLKEIQDREGWHDLHFVIGGEVLVNPLKFYEFALSKSWAAGPLVEGLQHGDLHGGNILLNRLNPQASSYWLVDFALSKVGPAGYDQAYLAACRTEVWALIDEGKEDRWCGRFSVLVEARARRGCGQPPARANMRLMFQAMVTMFHSPLTFSRPRSEN